MTIEMERDNGDELGQFSLHIDPCDVSVLWAHFDMELLAFLKMEAQ